MKEADDISLSEDEKWRKKQEFMGSLSLNDHLYLKGKSVLWSKVNYYVWMGGIIKIKCIWLI